MAGKIRTLIDRLIERKALGNAVLACSLETKLILKGIRPERYDQSSPDDPTIIEKITKMATDLGVSIA